MSEHIVYEYTIALKGIAEGAATFDEVVERLSDVVEEVKKISSTGKVDLVDEVAEGYINMTTEDRAVAEEFGFFALESYDDADAPDEDDSDDGLDEMFGE